MATVQFGNESVLEGYKPDQGTNAVLFKARKDLGNQITTMSLNETDVDDKPSRAMNEKIAIQMWHEHSDKAPGWVEGDDRLLVESLADYFKCPVGRPKNWTRD